MSRQGVDMYLDGEFLAGTFYYEKWAREDKRFTSLTRDEQRRVEFRMVSC